MLHMIFSLTFIGNKKIWSWDDKIYISVKCIWLIAKNKMISLLGTLYWNKGLFQPNKHYISQINVQDRFFFSVWKQFLWKTETILTQPLPTNRIPRSLLDGELVNKNLRYRCRCQRLAPASSLSAGRYRQQ